MNADLVSLVKLGYGDLFGKDARLLHFRTDNLKWNDAAEAVALVDEYNEYNGAEVAAAIPKIRDICRDSYQLSFEFGREFSPVLYIHIPFWIKEPGRDARPLSADETAEMIYKVQEIGRSLRADENGIAYAHVIRLWWD